MAQWEKLDQYFKGAEIVDLSPVLENGMPGSPAHSRIIIDPTITHEHDGYYCQTLIFGEHTGAHVDCPAYTLSDQMDKTVDIYPANILFAPAVKYDVFKTGVVPGEYVTKEDILILESEMGDSAGEGEIALLNFGWMQYWACDAGWKCSQIWTSFQPEAILWPYR